METKFVGLWLLLLFIFATETSMVEVEGATCTKPSKFFKGFCGFDSDCVKACSQENWPSGQCKNIGFFHVVCECQRPC